jgi:transaldolase
MNPTQKLHGVGQSLWLDNITRDLLENGTLKRYIDEFSITGLTSNPTIFDQAIAKSDAYDESIRKLSARGGAGEALLFDLALEDLTRAADLFSSIHQETDGVDGWVSLEVAPQLAYDAARSVAQAKELHANAQRPNLFIKIPGTAPGVSAIEEATFAGVPINVTLLFSREHYLAAADAYLRGLERRRASGLDLGVRSVASLFVSRWDHAVIDKAPAVLRNRLGIAIARRTYRAYRDLLESDRWSRIAAAGARPQRLLWGSTGTKDPQASDVLYVQALAAPDTINTMPEKTLLAFADHGVVEGVLPRDGGDAEQVLKDFAGAGIDVDGLAAKLQSDGAKAFATSWNNLMGSVAAKSDALRRSAPAAMTR